MNELPITDLTAESAGCQHRWHYTGSKQVGSPATSSLFIIPAQTIILLQCSVCGDLTYHSVAGHWDRQELGL